MKQQVKRITLTGTTFNEVKFDTTSNKYLVKNFSEGNIYVSTSANATDNNSIKIPSNFFQIVVENEIIPDFYSTNTLYIKGSGEVEVQQLCYK